MLLKSSFATVLRMLRSKRQISQRCFGDTSRTYLSSLKAVDAALPWTSSTKSASDWN